MRARAPWAAAVLGVIIWLASSPAQAQQHALLTSRPPVTWIGFGRPGDTTGGSGHVDRMGELAIEPLRLALLGNHPLVPIATPGCSDQLAQTKTGGGGFFPSMKTSATNLFGDPTSSSSKAPRLTLFGFSRGGCTLDGAAGGGATLIMPIQRDIFFVASGGAIYLPVGGPNGTATTTTTVRADVVFARPDGRSFSVGIGTTRGRPGLSFGGVF